MGLPGRGHRRAPWDRRAERPRRCVRSRGIVLRRESIRAAAVFADIRLVRHFPIGAAQSSTDAVRDERADQPLPGLPVVGLHHVLVKAGEEHAWLDVDAEERRRARRLNHIERAIERLEAVLIGLGQQVEIFLQEHPYQARPQRANLGHTVGPHRLGRQPALSERNAIHLDRPARSVERHTQCDRPARSGTACADRARWPATTSSFPRASL